MCRLRHAWHWCMESHAIQQWGRGFARCGCWRVGLQRGAFRCGSRAHSHGGVGRCEQRAQACVRSRSKTCNLPTTHVHRHLWILWRDLPMWPSNAAISGLRQNCPMPCYERSKDSKEFLNPIKILLWNCLNSILIILSEVVQTNKQIMRLLLLDWFSKYNAMECCGKL